MTAIFQIEPSQDDLAFPPKVEEEMKSLPFSKACMYALEGKKIKRAGWEDTYIILNPHSQNWAYSYDPLIKALVREQLSQEDIDADDWEII